MPSIVCCLNTPSLLYLATRIYVADPSWFFYLSVWAMFMAATQITQTAVHLVNDIRGAYKLVPPIGE